MGAAGTTTPDRPTYPKKNPMTNPMNVTTPKRSNAMHLLQEALSRARTRMAPRRRALPYRPALRVAYQARHRHPR